MGENDRNYIISKVIKISAHLKNNNKQHILRMHKEISERVKLKIDQKKKRRRGHIERKLREIVRVGGDICSALKDYEYY